MSEQTLLDRDAEPDHRGRVSVYLRELAVEDQRAKEDEGVWAGSGGGRGGDGGENQLRHPGPDQWCRMWVTWVLYSVVKS